MRGLALVVALLLCIVAGDKAQGAVSDEPNIVDWENTNHDPVVSPLPPNVNFRQYSRKKFGVRVKTANSKLD